MGIDLQDETGMKPAGLFGLAFCAAAALLCACGGKKDANSELQRAAAVMALPEPAQTAPEAAPAAQPAPAPSPQTTQPAVPAQTQAQELNQAIVAYKAGVLDAAVARLRNLRDT